MTTPSIYFKQLELGPMQNFVYLLGDPATHEAVVVDPGWQVPTILKAVEQDGYRLTRAIVTHHHFDHVGGLEELLKAVDIPVSVHKDDASHITLPRSSLQLAGDGGVVQVGSIPITLIHTPGHTQGSQCLLVGGRLLSGDTLFIKACGRCDLPDSDPRKLYNSLATKLARLDDQTIVCPGHNYAEVPLSTIADEKRDNPFLNLSTMEQFLHLVGAG
jgi:glyoxylase-like metal-dependent hydrolase (beta-lactamase superfamily II)